MIGLFLARWGRRRLGARPAGGFADKGKSHLTTNIRLTAAVTSLAIWLGHTGTGADYWHSGTDLTVQGVHITNQTAVIYRLHPDARNRAHRRHMTFEAIYRRRRVADCLARQMAGPAFVRRVLRIYLILTGLVVIPTAVPSG